MWSKTGPQIFPGLIPALIHLAATFPSLAAGVLLTITSMGLINFQAVSSEPLLLEWAQVLICYHVTGLGHWFQKGGIKSPLICMINFPAAISLNEPKSSEYCGSCWFWKFKQIGTLLSHPNSIPQSNKNGCIKPWLVFKSAFQKTYFRWQHIVTLVSKTSFVRCVFDREIVTSLITHSCKIMLDSIEMYGLVRIQKIFSLNI